MSIADRILDVSYNNLDRLYDVDGKGFFFHIDQKDCVKGEKILRYNARIIELLDGYYDANMLRSTAGYLVATFPPLSDVCLGDIGLLITALNKLGCYPTVVDVLKKKVICSHIEQLKKIDLDRVFWVLESCDVSGLKEYVLGKRKLKHKLKRKFFGVDYVCISTVLYAIHYLTVKGFYGEAMRWYKFLVNTFFLDTGEWMLSYFPWLHYTSRKAFSVHQLGMAPLYLLELYEHVHEESMLDVVKKSVQFGYRFLNGNKVYRNLRNKETRSYECAFDIRGLLKAREFDIV